MGIARISWDNILWPVVCTWWLSQSSQAHHFRLTLEWSCSVHHYCVLRQQKGSFSGWLLVQPRGTPLTFLPPEVGWSCVMLIFTRRCQPSLLVSCGYTRPHTDTAALGGAAPQDWSLRIINNHGPPSAPAPSAFHPFANVLPPWRRTIVTESSVWPAPWGDS